MKLYNDYNSYLKERFGTKVYRIGIDAGFKCPSICAYCNNKGSRAAYSDNTKAVGSQLSERIAFFKRTDKNIKFIAYFQSFTNTNAPVNILRDTYDAILPFKDIVGLSIGTRPDCVDSKKLELIAAYRDRYDVWVEYGLQSIHDKTLKAINRGHDFNDFVKSYEATKALSIPVCVHIIIGLPGETREDVVSTAVKLNELKIDAVKIHLLHILKDSAMETAYINGAINVLTQNEYAGLVADFLEHLSKRVIIQRLTAQGRREDHIAPLWALDKLRTIAKIEEVMRKRGSYQGIHCS